MMLHRYRSGHQLTTTLLLGSLLLSDTTTAAAAAPPTLFEMSLEQLMQIEVAIASGDGRRVSEAPAVVTLITRNDLKQTGATNVIEALESVPGIHVRFNRMAYSPFIHMRGTNTNQVLLLVNGVSMRSLTSAWPQDLFWKGLPVSAVERVEVIRGPGSALYGADASAGVINIITRTAETIDQSEAGVRLGSFNRRSAWLEHGGTISNQLDFGLTAALSSTSGHDPLIQADRSGTGGTAALGWDDLDLRTYLASTDHWRIQADYTRQSDLEIGFNGAGYFDPLTRGDTQRANLAWLYSNDRFTDTLKLEAELRYQHLQYDSGEGFLQAPAAVTGTPYGKIDQQATTEQQLGFEISTLFSGLEGHHIRLGTGLDSKRLSDIKQLVNFDSNGEIIGDGATLVDISTDPSRLFANPGSRQHHYLFAQDVWNPGERWEVTAGVRYDHYSDFGSTLNPRIALVWNTTDRLTTRLLYGEAFRAPSFIEVDNPLGADLGPEQSRTREIAFSYAFSQNFNVGLNYFDHRLNDMIARSSGKYLNRDRFTIDGYELEFNWEPSENTRISGNYTARNPQENSARKDYEPYQDGYLRIDWRPQSSWNWNLQGNWMGERKRSSSDTREDLERGWIIDTTVRYSGTSNWEVAASIRNLLDEEARESTSGSIPDDLPLPERNFWLEARYHF